MSELAPDGLPKLRDVIAAHGLAAKKSLGQNFILDLNLTGRIARASGDVKDAQVVEIGPGPGGLTRALLTEGAAKVIAVERDERCLPALAEIQAAYPGRLNVVNGDAMKIDPRSHLTGPARIVANLPYNVGTALLVGWLTSETWPPWWESLTLMFQREVAERIVAAPGSKTFGRLSVLSQWRTNAEIAFSVPASAFTPPPKVTSAIVSIRPKEQPSGIDPKRLSCLTAAAFAQRRKMLRQSLKTLSPQAASLIETAGIDPTRRAETLTIQDFLNLTRVFQGADKCT